MVDLDAARLQSVGNIGGTGYYYTNVICVFAMANFVLQLCKTRYLENKRFYQKLQIGGGKKSADVQIKCKLPAGEKY